MKLRNTTPIDNELIREAIRFVRPAGMANFDVMIKNSKTCQFRGMAYTQGSGYHATADPFITVGVCVDKYRHPNHINWRKAFPYKGEEGGRKSQARNGAYRNISLYTPLEAIVYVLAHELRHLWQAKHKRGYRSWGSRGQFSEKDAEDYAIHMIRAWRKSH